jgi:N-acetylmuramoyl-L-alanine amidase
VAAFQRSRRLPDDGVCDVDTWIALVEAGWIFGDRVLYHRTPNLRGDDVAELQQRLGRMGFDAGRVDGILGPRTTAALQEFQRNVGLPADGVCGPETVTVLRTLGSRTTEGPAVAALREAERLREQTGLAGARIVVGHFGGLGMVTRMMGRMLRGNGATVLAADELDQRAHAVAANEFAASVYVGVRAAEQGGPIAFYATDGFESVGGHRLAELLVEGFAVTRLEHLHTGPSGMRLPVLRETRMPAVLCELGPTKAVVDHTPTVATAITQALRSWCQVASTVS